MSEDNRSLKRAKRQLESLRERVAALKEAQDTCNDEAYEEAREAIQGGPFSVQVRGGWYDPTEKSLGPEEFSLLLCGGGPAVRVIGDLDDNCQPITARLQYQDWFVPWADFYCEREEDEEMLLEYCRQFYFGE